MSVACVLKSQDEAGDSSHRQDDPDRVDVEEFLPPDESRRGPCGREVEKEEQYNGSDASNGEINVKAPTPKMPCQSRHRLGWDLARQLCSKSIL